MGRVTTMWYYTFVIISIIICVCHTLPGTFISDIDEEIAVSLLKKYGEDQRLSRQSFISLGMALRKLDTQVPLPCNLTDGDCGGNNITKFCLDYGQIFDIYAHGGYMSSESLIKSYPLLIFTAQNTQCTSPPSGHHDLHHRHKPTIGQAWGYGIGFCSLVVLISNIGAFLGPVMKTRVFKRILMFCVALAVGTLAATGFLVLLPESMHLTADDSPIPDYHWKLSTVMGGAYFVFLAERMLNVLLKRRKDKNKQDTTTTHEISLLKEKETDNINGYDHSHSHVEIIENEDGKKVVAPVAWILLIGDALHNFVDGLSIGAAFTENTFIGISVSLAVVCEELPHELGDIAILLHAGLSIKRALLYNFIAAVICYLGLIIGVLVGENTDANQWIFGFAGGLFIYIALSDMIPEMAEQLKAAERDKTEQTFTVLILQNVGLLTGFSIILILVVYGGNIQL